MLCTDYKTTTQKIVFFNTISLVFTVLRENSLQCQLPLACVPLKNCDALKTMIKTSKNHQETLRFLKSQFCDSHSETEIKVCCPDVRLAHKSIKKQLSESPCKPTFRCVSLLECHPLKPLLTTGKPVVKGAIKFIKSQQCGVDGIYPKVCCKEESQSKQLDHKIIITTERVAPVSTTMSLKEKTEAINKYFSGDWFDDLMFDLI